MENPKHITYYAVVFYVIVFLSILFTPNGFEYVIIVAAIVSICGIARSERSEYKLKEKEKKNGTFY